MRPRRTLDVCLLLSVLSATLLVACSKPQPAAEATPVARPSSAVAPVRRVASTPCELITEAELHAVFHSTASSRPERHEAFGIASCEWNGDFGRLLVQQWASKGHTPQDEIRAVAAGSIDSRRPGAAQRVRLVPLAGLGHYATAVVEARDLQGGVLSDVAALSIARNGQTLVFLTDALDAQDREAALAKLTQLGRYAYARL